MASGVNEEETAVDTGILNVAVAHRGKLLTEIGAVLVLDITDDRVPAAFVIDLVAVSWSIDDVEAETDAIFSDDVRNGLALRGLLDGLVRLKTAFRVDQVGGKDRVYQSRLSETGLTNNHDVELEAPLQELVLNLTSDRVETDIGGSLDFFAFSSHGCLCP